MSTELVLRQDVIASEQAFIEDLVRNVPVDLEIKFPYLAGSIQRLDAFCSFIGQNCLLNGYGRSGPLGRNGHIALAEEDFMKGIEARSAGYDVVPMHIKGQLRWCVVPVFHTETVTPDYENMPGALATGYAFHPKSLLVTPLEEVEDVYAAIDDERIMARDGILSGKSESFAEYLRSDDFLSLSTQEQLAMIRTCLSEVQDEAEEILSFINQPVNILSAERAYVRMPSPRATEYQEVDTSEWTVQGKCKGLEVLCQQKLSFGHRIETTDELVDEAAGFCLKVEIDERLRQVFGATEDPHLYVPIAGQDIEVQYNAT